LGCNGCRHCAIDFAIDADNTLLEVCLEHCSGLCGYVKPTWRSFEKISAEKMSITMAQMFPRPAHMFANLLPDQSARVAADKLDMWWPAYY